jgi:hypothetical protein
LHVVLPLSATAMLFAALSDTSIALVVGAGAVLLLLVTTRPGMPLPTTSLSTCGIKLPRLSRKKISRGTRHDPRRRQQSCGHTAASSGLGEAIARQLGRNGARPEWARPEWARPEWARPEWAREVLAATGVARAAHLGVATVGSSTTRAVPRPGAAPAPPQAVIRNPQGSPQSQPSGGKRARQFPPVGVIDERLRTGSGRRPWWRYCRGQENRRSGRRSSRTRTCRCRCPTSARTASRA